MRRDLSRGFAPHTPTAKLPAQNNLRNNALGGTWQYRGMRRTKYRPRREGQSGEGSRLALLLAPQHELAKHGIPLGVVSGSGAHLPGHICLKIARYRLI